ncbi:PssD/Cps14F family polysaccharide biosynthesis glycosyltransferase [Alistipes putredinis]|uniref:PssD/Cps14F family polysaccharide biosynthesis glycosyltransferase n=1 Tax=Alistipes putredinis TaxID=28117 RepID=UPI003A840A8D
MVQRLSLFWSVLVKVCFAASSGGHFEQLMMLAPLIRKYDGFIVTEETDYAMSTGFKTYELKQVNRHEKGFLLKIMLNGIISLQIYLKEKPEAIVCTGVLATIPMCLICKIAGKKLVYIESFAKVSSSTQTGRLMYKFADRFYVQWASMLEIYPNAIYVGGIY